MLLPVLGAAFAVFACRTRTRRIRRLKRTKQEAPQQHHLVFELWIVPYHHSKRLWLDVWPAVFSFC
jgi:hypothetical protein